MTFLTAIDSLNYNNVLHTFDHRWRSSTILYIFIIKRLKAELPKRIDIFNLLYINKTLLNVLLYARFCIRVRFTNNFDK